MRFNVRFVVGCAVLLFLANATSVHGQTEWTAATGSWFDAGNWSLGTPGVGSTVGIHNGGSVQVAAPGAVAATTTLGGAAGQSGTIAVSGAGTLSTQTLTIGGNGNGSFSVVDGAVATSTSASLAGTPSGGSATPQGTATIAGANSRWTITNTLTVGSIGGGSLNVDDGALVAANRVDVAVFASTGRVTLTRGGTLRVGNGAQQLALLKGGGEIRIGNGDIAGILDASQVHLGFGGNLLSFNHTNDIAFSPRIFGGGNIVKEGPGGATLSAMTSSITGTITVQEGVLRVSGGLTPASTTVNGGTFEVNGSALAAVVVNNGGAVDGSGLVGSVTVNAGGTLAAGGGGAATLTTGALSLASESFMRLDFSNFINDNVQVNGNVTLDGMLQIRKLPGYAPGAFTILNYTGAATDMGLAFEAPFLAAHPGSTIVHDAAGKRVVVTITPGTFLAGDFDENGVVGASDLVRWKVGAQLVGTPTHFEGDADGDGDADGADFLTWQRQLGQFSTAAAAAGAVPEPGTLTMLAGAVLLVARFTRGTRPRRAAKNLE